MKRIAGNSSREAFTLLEVMLSIAVIAVMGLSIAGVSMALSTAHENSQDQYQCTQAGRIVMMRLEQAFRQAHLITDAAGSSLILWSDANADGDINITELTALMWSSRSQALIRYRIQFPEGWSEYRKKLYDAHVPLSAATFKTMARSPYFRLYREETLLAEQVENFALGLSPAAPLTTSVSIDMTITKDQGSLALRSGASLRADQTHRVQPGGGGYTLTP